ncbi:MAG TPA: hypothetical protein VGA37_13985 [Gemmatimonadales bacterium]
MTKRFLPPPYPRSHPGWGIASAVVHVVVIALFVVFSGPSFQREVVSFIALPPGGDPREVDLPSRGPIAPGEGAERDEAGPAPVEVAIVPPAGVPTGVAPEVPRGDSAVREGQGAGGRAGGRLGGPGRRVLVPRLGDGRLWLRPGDAIAAAIADAVAGDTSDARHLERLDSALADKIYAFLDTLPRDSMAVAAPPSWVAEVNGQQWGIDGSWIYLGGLKLPTMILGLLPWPQGNFEQGQRAAELMRIREDILQAARRAETAEQFRTYVEETRERREAAREFERNRRVPPRDTVRTQDGRGRPDRS